MPDLTRDGVKLHYEDQGSGSTMVFVHGWTCDLSHFAPQVSHYVAKHRCISVDLRGHGQSDKPEQEYSIETFADDVAWMCGELGVKKAVFAGHSMGGAIVLELAHQHPELAAAVIMLDPAILFAPELLPMLAQLITGFRSPDGPAVVREFATNAFFLPSSDPAFKAKLLDEMCKTPMHVAASAFESVGEYGGEDALKALGAPALFVEADPVYNRVDRLREIAPNVATAKTVGAGHFHQLEVPDQINAMMDRFLAINSLA